MDRRKNKRTRRKNRVVKADPLFISPDGGETVYQQFPNVDRKLVSRSKLAQDIEYGYLEEEMIGPVAIELRRKNPILQKAWDKYRTILHLINENY